MTEFLVKCLREDTRGGGGGRGMGGMGGRELTGEGSGR